MSTNTVIFVILSVSVCAVLIAFFMVYSRFKRTQSLKSHHVNEQIYVGNLAYRIDEKELYDFFSRYGIVQTIRIVRNFKTGRSKGYAFITYEHKSQASKALMANGKDLYGRSLVVRIAKPRQQQPEY